MTERVQLLQAQRKRSQRVAEHTKGYARGEKKALAKEISEERKERLRAAVEHERATVLNDVDRVYASGYILPRTRLERIAEANRLLTTPSGRKRSYREVAAVMGVTVHAVGSYLNDPDLRFQKRLQEQRVSTPRQREDWERLPEPEHIPEPDVPEPFGKVLKRRRKRGTISQAKLAEALGWPVEKIRELEANEVWPTPGRWLDIRLALDRLENPPEDEG
jgi:uncharacterized protein YdbL (DUF1318 family)